MGIYGSRDVIVDPHAYQPLRSGVPQARIEIMPNSGHFPMLDEPERYLGLVRSFLDQPPVAPVARN
jgi:pimeloyl-ACP methyl ester carboxylesterase